MLLRPLGKRAASRCALVLVGLLMPGCRLELPGNDAGADAGPPPTDAEPDAALPDATPPDAAPPDAAPPFTCTPEPATSPVLAARLALDPAEPHPGDTVTVVVVSTTVDRGDAPPMLLEALSAGGLRTFSPQAMAGGRAVYYYEVPDVAEGEICLVGRINGQPEIAARLTVTPRPPPPPRCAGGVYKVVTHHQWTCDEQPEWGNEVVLVVRDADGQPQPGVTVRIDWADTTLRPIYNDAEPPAPSEIPETVVTGDDGAFHGYDYWPVNENGYMVFNLLVDGCASDVATEITTGWWETTNDGCRYCDPAYGARNVWGHWSHTVELQLDPAATEACVVPSDHAGQAACTPDHVHHDPAVSACYPVP